MIIETSALVAILRTEPEAEAFVRIIERAATRRVSAGSYLETAIVLDAAHDPIVSRRFDEFIAEASIIVEPVTAEQAEIGRAAYRDFGKRSGHLAQLNFGDCFSYALAKVTGEPLLSKGDDFGHTDVRPAV